VTIRVTWVEWVRVALVAVIVSGYVPGGVVLAVVIDREEVPRPKNEAGLKVAVVSAGKPARLRETFPSKPLLDVTLTEYVVLAPAVTVLLGGIAAMEKSGGSAVT